MQKLLPEPKLLRLSEDYYYHPEDRRKDLRCLTTLRPNALAKKHRCADDFAKHVKTVLFLDKRSVSPTL